MIIHQSKNAQVEWLEDSKIVLKTFYAFIYGDEMKAAFNVGLEVIIKYKSCKWLSNNRGLKPYRQEDVVWINEVWLPQMLKAGWKYWAVVEPDNILGQSSMKNFLDFYQQQGITLQIFHNVEDALKALESI